MAFVEARGVHKAFGSTAALRGLDFSLGEGEWCAAMGPSGAGKTTLLNVLAGIESPTAGTVRIGETEITSLNEDQLARFRRETIGLIFQRSHLLPYLDAVENVMLAQYLHSVSDEAEAIAALRRVGLGERLHHRPSQLSGGEQQRVGIARALINRPRLLLADEPTGNLDQDNSRRILELLRELHQEEQFSLVVVTHDPEVAAWSTRIVTLVDGRVASDEPTPGYAQEQAPDEGAGEEASGGAGEDAGEDAGEGHP